MSETEAKCPFEDVSQRDEWEALLYVRGGMSASEREVFEKRLAVSEPLRRELARVERTVEVLLDLPDREPARDLTAGVLKAIERPPPQLRVVSPPRASRSRWMAFAHVAALLVVAVGLWSLIVHMNSGDRPAFGGGQAGVPPFASPDSLEQQRSDSVASAVRWLLLSQETDGSWDPRRWQGQAPYRVGLTALALSAFSRYADAFGGEETTSARDRAVSYLVSQQNPDGSFGPAGDATMYNHGLATIALLRACAHSSDAGTAAAQERAVAFIQSRQLPTGGWSYNDEKGAVPNSSLSVWQLLALNIAREQQVAVDPQVLSRGRTWLGSVVNGQGQFGYHERNDRPAGSDTLTAMGALCLLRSSPKGAQPDLRPMVRRALRRVLTTAPENVDFYRWYFVASAIAVDPRATRDDDLAPLHLALVSHRIPSGEHAGSWPLEDRWSKVGGRVYTTGMAAMALLPGEGALPQGKR